jgi:hypothetical protein
MFGPFWQYQIPLWSLAILFAVLLLFPLELGLRLGTRARSAHPDPEALARSDITLPAMLTLLALMLAFTYSFSMSRADLRKKELVSEVNSISTAFLRSDLLPEPERSKLRAILYDYTRSRYVKPGTITTLEGVEQVVSRSAEIQSRIWPAVKEAIRQPGEMTDPEKALLVSAINDVLDAHTRRMAVFFDRLPTAILGLLLLIAGTSLGLAAYNASMGGLQIRWRLTAFALILVCLIYIILDFDMMQRGLIQIDNGSLVQLIEEMEAAVERSP